MMRSVPGLLDPGAPPQFDSPGDVIAWVRAVDWLVAAERAVLLHVDHERRLTCVAAGNSLLKHLGPTTKEALIADALECRAGAVLAVDVRRKLTPKAPTIVDQRHYRRLRQDFAVHAIVLLDTVIVTPDDGVSVTGSAVYPASGSPSWLQVHTPPPRPAAGGVRIHEEASLFPPGSARVRGPVARLQVVHPPDR